MMHSVRSSAFQFNFVKFVFSCGHRSDRPPSRECVLEMMHSVPSSSFQFNFVKFVFFCGHSTCVPLHPRWSDRSPSRECVLGMMHSVRSSRGGRTRRCRGRTCARSWISCASSGFSLLCQVTSDSRLVQTSGCEPCVVCVPSVSLLQCRPHDRANVRPGAAGESAAFEANCGEGHPDFN